MASLPDAELHLQVLANSPQHHISELHRFGMLVAGSIGMICASLGFAFNLIMPSMQTRYNFTQRETASVTTVGLVFGYFMLPFGTLYDYFGPLPVAALSMISYPLGAILTALCFEGVISGSVVRLCVFNAMQNVGLSLTDLVCCMTVLSHFPSNRGPVIALLKTLLGLGSAIVGSLFTGFFNGHISHYLYFLAVLSFVMNTVCVVVMRLPAYHLTQWEERRLSAEEKERRGATKAQYLKQRPPMWRFVYGFVVLVVLIVYLPTTSALVAYQGLGRNYKLGFAIVTAVVTCLYTLVAVPLPAALTRRISWCARENASDDDAEETARAAGVEGTSSSRSAEREPCHAEEKGVVAIAADMDVCSDAQEAPARRPVETDVDYLAPQYQGSFLRNLRTLELWALWWSMFAVIGAEFVIIYNATFVLGALQGYKPSLSQTTLLTVLNGVGSAVGRLLMSAFEVWSQKRRVEDRVPITVALFFSTSAIIVTIVLFLTLPAAALPLPYILAALGNGFYAATQILVTRTIFAKDPAKHYHFCFSATMVASILFNRLLYGEWYTVQAEKQGSKLCYGKGCVLMPLVVMLSLATSAFITDVVVHFRYRAYSRRVLVERARLRGEASGSEGTDDVTGAPCHLDDGLRGEPRPPEARQTQC